MGKFAHRILYPHIRITTAITSADMAQIAVSLSTIAKEITITSAKETIAM
jgi:hypothetical protein